MEEMRQRVQCDRCKAHRDQAIAPRCLVCGYEAWTAVVPTAGDRAAAAAKLAEVEVLAAAEAIDAELYEGAQIANGHRCATRLSEACRKLALARAGAEAPC